MRLLAIILVISFLQSCKENSPYKDYSKTDYGLNYKLISLGDGQRVVKKDDYLTLNYAISTYDTLIRGRQILKLHQLERENDLIEALSLMKQGDSISAYLKSENINKGLLQRHQYLKKGELCKIELKLEELLSDEEFLLKKENFFKWLVENKIEDVNTIKEEKSIKEYLSQQELNFSVTPTGLYYAELKSGKGSSVEFGEAVIIHFEGYTLDGFKFDSTKERKAWFDFIVGQDDQVIRGIEEGLFLMNKKSKYRFVIPSYLAFKDRGTVNGKVKPFTPVVYDVELIDKR